MSRFRVPPSLLACAAAAAALPAVPSFADLLVFNGFADTSLLDLNASAATVRTADGTVLRVTPAFSSQSGSAFSLATVDAATFSTYFAFRITDPDGSVFDCNVDTGADGLVFVVQSISSSVGGLGQGIGYEGIQQSVGVEFDTWCNVVNNDPSSNHVGININGVVDHGVGAPFTVDVEPRFDNGALWYAWVDYDGTTLRAYLNTSPIQPFQPILQRDLDLSTILQQPTGFVGFTSGTGSDWGNHDVVYWEYTPFAPVCLGDFDGNGLINGSDLAVLLGNWGGDLKKFDLNGDDEIDGNDVAILLGNWGDCVGN